MKAVINIALVLVVVTLIAGVVFLFRIMGSDEEKPGAKNGSTAKPIVYMSTSGVVDNIERRLEPKAGPLKVKCPKKVSDAIGTKFRCSIRYDGGTERIAIASVKISGPQGEFTWTSSSDSLRKNAPTPAP